MNIEYLHEFLDLANTLNFTKTASNLHMAQPTLSRHISDLEKQVNAPLFERSATGVRLTQSGRVLYEKATSLLNGYSDIVDSLRQANEQPKETVLVSGSSVQPTIKRLFSKLSFRAAFQKAPVRLEYCKTRSLSNNPPVPYALDALVNREIDFIIDTCRFDAEAPERFDSIRLCDEPISFIAGSDNPLSRTSKLHLEDLFACTFVVFAVQQHCPKVLLAPMEKLGYSLSRAHVVFIDNMLEIPEKLADLKPDEIVPMQQFYCSEFGFDRDGLGGKLCTLDVQDDRARSGLWALARKDDQKPGVHKTLELVQSLVDDAKERAQPTDWATDDTLWASAYDF